MLQSLVLYSGLAILWGSCLVGITTSIHAQNSLAKYKTWEIQQHLTDNLTEQIKQCHDFLESDTSVYRFYAVFALAQLYQAQRKLDSSLHYFDQATQIGQQYRSTELLASSYAAKATFLAREYNEQEKAKALLQKVAVLLKDNKESTAWKHYYQGYADLADMNGQYEVAIRYVDSMILISRAIKDTAALSLFYNNKGLYLRFSPNYEAAATNFLYAVQLEEAARDSGRLSTTYFNLAVCYYYSNQYQLAIKYANKCIQIARATGNDYVELVGYLILSPSLRKSDEFEPTLAITDRAMSLAEALNDSLQIANVFKEKGWIYFSGLGDYPKAEAYFFQGYELVKNSQNYKYIQICLHGLIESYLKQKKFARAATYMPPFEAATQRVNSLAYKERFHQCASSFYELTGKPTAALAHYKQYTTIKDSIVNINVQTKVADLEQKYETQKKELEIARLTQATKQQEVAMQQATNRQIILLIATVFLFSILIIGYWAFRKLRKQQQELTAINAVKDRLFSIIAHDLKGMLLPFQRAGKILKYHINKGNHKRTVELSQALEENSERLSATLNNMLDWSLEQMNGYKMHPEIFSIQVQLLEIISGYQPQATYKNIEIELVTPSSTFVELDKGAFHIVFRNLISNALKYTQNGQIKIETQEEGRNLCCSISDTGVGMNADQIAAAFDLNRQKIATGTQGEKGSGIGLHLVQRFVQMHQGSIKVSSTLGKGTRFDLFFPNTIAPNRL